MRILLTINVGLTLLLLWLVVFAGQSLTDDGFEHRSQIQDTIFAFWEHYDKVEGVTDETGRPCP